MEKNKQKRNLLIIGIMALVIAISGVTYAFFTYSNTGRNQELVTGDIWMHYKESNTLTLSNMFPSENFSEYFEFTVEGKNTSNKDIYYEIVIDHGDEVSGKTRIADEYLKFKLVEVINETEGNDLLLTNQYYKVDKERVYVRKIDGDGANAERITHKYRLYVRIDENTVITGGNTTGDYSQEEWNNLYASIKVNVAGDFTVKTVEPKILVTYNANGGRVRPSKKQLTASNTTYGPLATPTRDGYEFIGWYTDPTNGTLVTNETSFNGTSTILYAHWGKPEVFTVNAYSTNIGSTIPNEVTTYDNPEDAMNEWITTFGLRTKVPVFLKHKLNSNQEITESYLGFEVTEEMVQDNPGMIAGYYYLRGGDSGASFTENMNVIKTAFDYANHPDRCDGNQTSDFHCDVSGLYAEARSDGDANANDSPYSDGGFSCDVYNDGSYCSEK